MQTASAQIDNTLAALGEKALARRQWLDKVEEILRGMMMPGPMQEDFKAYNVEGEAPALRLVVTFSKQVFLSIARMNQGGWHRELQSKVPGYAGKFSGIDVRVLTTQQLQVEQLAQAAKQPALPEPAEGRASIPGRPKLEHISRSDDEMRAWERRFDAARAMLGRKPRYE